MKTDGRHDRSHYTFPTKVSDVVRDHDEGANNELNVVSVAATVCTLDECEYERKWQVESGNIDNSNLTDST